MSQDFLDFSDGSKPSFLKELHGEISRPVKRPIPRPPGAKKKLLHTHFALLHLNKPQPPKPPGWKSKKFEWPEYCHETGQPWMQFDDKKAIDKWLNGGKAYKVWQCEACKKLHYIPYPHDITGTTSGKSIRSNQFRIRMGESPEKVYELETNT